MSSPVRWLEPLDGKTENRARTCGQSRHGFTAGSRWWGWRRQRGMSTKARLRPLARIPRRRSPQAAPARVTGLPVVSGAQLIRALERLGRSRHLRSAALRNEQGAPRRDPSVVHPELAAPSAPQRHDESAKRLAMPDRPAMAATARRAGACGAAVRERGYSSRPVRPISSRSVARSSRPGGRTE